MAEPTGVILVIAGSGETDPKEVFDLLEDSYPAEKFEVGVVVPVDKDLFTPSVQNAVDWASDEIDVTPIQTEGAALSRKSSSLGETQKVKSFSEILNKAEFEEWDEVHFLVAMPDAEESEADEYNLYADLVAVALENGLVVKDLCAGLDDVQIAEDEAEPAPEPEPEPEEPKKRTRRSRAKATEPETPVDEALAKVAEAKAEPKDLQEELSQAAFKAESAQPLDDRFRYHPPTDASKALHEDARGMAAEFAAWAEGVGESSRERSLSITKIEEALFWLNAHIARNITGSAPQAESKGRGRPRTNFEVKQIQDENGEWIPRPKGRVRKGTAFRTIHAETEQVLEEGTV